MPAAYLIASLPGDNLSWIGVGFGCCPLGFGGSPHLWQGMSEVSHRVTSLGRASSPPRTHMLNPGYDISSRQRKLQLPRRKSLSIFGVRRWSGVCGASQVLPLLWRE